MEGFFQPSVSAIFKMLESQIAQIKRMKKRVTVSKRLLGFTA